MDLSNKSTERVQTCGFGDYEATSPVDLKEHERKVHGIINCNLCDYSALDRDILRKHMTKHTGRIIFQCGRCEFEATKEALLEDHKETKHTEQPNPMVDKRMCQKCEKEFDAGFVFEAHKCIITSKFQCEQCPFKAVTLSELLEHMVPNHAHELKQHLAQIKKPEPEPVMPDPEPKGIQCDQCHFVAEEVSTMVFHIRTTHTQHACHICAFQSQNKEDMKSHMYDHHPEVVMIHTIAEQMNIMSDRFEVLEDFVKKTVDERNAMEQELFLIRTKLAERDNYEKEKKQQQHSPRSVPPPPSCPPPRHQCPPSHSPPKSSPIKNQPQRRTYAEVSRENSKTSTPSARPSQHHQNRILFVGDSISSNVDIKMLEGATKARITTAKAYSSTFDVESNVAKQAARYPASNFEDVVKEELVDKSFKTLLLQAGSVDITNLNTNEQPERYMEYFRQIAVMSATNLFQVAQNTLKESTNINKVIIMQQIPRYDPQEVDPLALKPSLSLLFNNTLTNLWADSPLRNQIFIGVHNIECNGAIREARYRHTKSGRFDGIHLFGSSGRKAYTRSVLNILQSANITSPDFHGPCEQFVHQYRDIRAHRWQGNNHSQPRNTIERANSRDKYTSTRQNVFTIPTQNRFDALYGQGNW